MIIEVEGDILLTKSTVIAHGVAANDPMNEGLAKSLHEGFPAMHKDYHRWCHQQHPKPGSAWMWGGTGGVRIVNLLTQEGGYGHGARPGKATITNVRHSLKELKKMAAKEGFESLALPRLGTGVGGLDWSEVQPVIAEQMNDINIPIYVYSVFRPGQQASES